VRCEREDKKEKDQFIRAVRRHLSRRPQDLADIEALEAIEDD